MARILNPEDKGNPALAEAIGGASRSRGNVRETGVRGTKRRKQNDKFFVPPDLIPKNYVVEWKRQSCLGQPEAPDYQMDLADGGWKYADAQGEFKVLMPEGYTGKTVERGGMVLMIRPKHLKEESLRLDREEAESQVRDKLAEIGMTGQGEMKRVVGAFSRGYDRPAGRVIPEDDGEVAGEE